MKFIRTTLIGIFVLGCLVLFSQTLSRAAFGTGEREIKFLPNFMLSKTINKKVALSSQEAVPGHYPARLRIPSLSVNTPIQYVGVTYRGNMGAPSNYKEVGWYKYGPVPGEKGSAAIAGHVDNGLAMPGVFSGLEGVAAGEKVYIDTVEGETLEFEVIEKKVYNFDAKAEEVFGESEEPLLKLITCAGLWQADYDTHSERLVVTARRTDAGVALGPGER